MYQVLEKGSKLTIEYTRVLAKRLCMLFFVGIFVLAMMSNADNFLFARLSYYAFLISLFYAKTSRYVFELEHDILTIEQSWPLLPIKREEVLHFRAIKRVGVRQKHFQQRMIVDLKNEKYIKLLGWRIPHKQRAKLEATLKRVQEHIEQTILSVEERDSTE